MRNIDERKYQYYVVYVKNPEVSQLLWKRHAVYKGFLNQEDVILFIKKLEEEGVKIIDILSPDEYNNMRNQY
jgi:predicted RNA-binding protein